MKKTKGYRVWLLERDQVKIHRDVVFTNRQYKHHLAEKKSTESEISFDYSVEDTTTPNEEGSRPVQMQVSSQDSSNDSDTEANLQNATEQMETKRGEQNQGYQLRNRESIKPPSRYHDTCISVVDYEEPEYEEAITNSDANKWK